MIQEASLAARRARLVMEPGPATGSVSQMGTQGRNRSEAKPESQSAGQGQHG